MNYAEWQELMHEFKQHNGINFKFMHAFIDKNFIFNFQLISHFAFLQNALSEHHC
jgi:hypothetical protein